jgi:hypothetical protein
MSDGKTPKQHYDELLPVLKAIPAAKLAQRYMPDEEQMHEAERVAALVEK